MVTGFCLPYQYWLVDVCIVGCAGNCCSITYNEFPGNKSSDCKSGKEFENGIVIQEFFGAELKNKNETSVASHFYTTRSLLIDNQRLIYPFKNGSISELQELLWAKPQPG